MSIPVAAGAAIPLQLQLATSKTGLFVRAYLYNGDGSALNSGTPVALTHSGNGLYQNRTFFMPNTPFVVATYQVALDAGFTSIAPQDGSGIDVFNLETVAQDIIRRDSLIAVVKDKTPVLSQVVGQQVVRSCVKNKGVLNQFVTSTPILSKTIQNDVINGVVKCH